MKSNIRKITIKTFSLLMIMIMGLLIANKGLYMHSHKLDNDSIITHSHPFNKEQDSQPYKSHHHTKAEFIIFENSDILFSLVFLIIVCLPLIRKRSSFVGEEKFYHGQLSNLYLGRAPPVS